MRQVFLIFILLFYFSANAQQSKKSSIEDTYYKALELDKQGDYDSAYDNFCIITRGGDKKSEYYNMAGLKVCQYWIMKRGDDFGHDPELEKKLDSEAFRIAKSIAENGLPEAMNLVGLLYASGKGTPKDDSKAKYWWSLSAEKYNNPLAKFCLVWFCDSDSDRFKLLLSAADDGLDEAIVILRNVENNTITNEVLLSTIPSVQDKILNASPGYNNSYSSSTYQTNTVPPTKSHFQSEDNEFTSLLNSAQKGNVADMYKVGECYIYGTGVKADDNKAFEWLLKAANENHSDAQALVSAMYATGKGTSQNDKLAFYWAKKSADMGNPEGLMCSFQMYMEGIGTPKDSKKAFECLLQAANLDFSPAFMNLGQAYIFGYGVDVNPEEGFLWIKRGAQEGDIVSYAMLSLLYTYGIGTTKNLYEARKWAEKAMAENIPEGYFALATLYSDGPLKDTNKALFNIDKGISRLTESMKKVDSDYNDWNILDYYYIKGKIYLADGQLDKAREQVVEILKINPDYKGDFDNSLMDFYYGRDKDTPLVANEQIKEIESDIDANIPINNIQNTNTFAIVIGNEHYEDVANVEFANRDADSFAKYCENVLGIPNNNIRRYKDATYGKMIGALEDIRSIAKAYNGNLNIIFYYAGHGIPNEKDFSSYLLPIDGSGRTTNLCLSLNNLYETLSETNANRIMVFLDACFSGATRGDGMLTAARGVAIKAQPEDPRQNMVIFTASSDDETAYPYREQGHGLFTYYLLKKLQQSKGNLTLAELSNYINESVRRQSVVINRKSQTPTTAGSVDLNVNWFTE